jgi:gliding motility-associated-like protein
MTRLFLLSFLLCSLAGMSQMSVLVKPADTLVCFRDSVAFEARVINAGPGADTVYRWQRNGVDIPGASAATWYFTHVSAADTGRYRCIVSVGIVTDTSNTARLRMRPRMKIDTLYRYNALDCPAFCKGQFKVKVSGGTTFANYPPYIYEWHGGHSQDTLVFGLCKGKNILSITDSTNCVLDTTYFVDVLHSPKVDFEILPGDTVYLTNPNITVQFQDSLKKKMTNWGWDFGDTVKVNNLNPATHTYARTGTFPVRLSFTDYNGCDTTITHDLIVKVVELKIPNVFTPNGDQINDQFAIVIKGNQTADWREAYISNELVVFDRWGKRVFDQTNYKSKDWDGANLPDGTYFYVLKCHGQFGDDVFKGSVTILRGASQQ